MKLSRIASFGLALMLLLTLTPMGFADETEATEGRETKENIPAATSGTCGDNLTWELTGSVLTISGSGEMAEGAPWQGSKDTIQAVILEGGVTTVAKDAFNGYEKLTSVDFGGSLREIGKDAFRECVSLEELRLPETFRIFGPGCFYGCTALAEIYCYGGMPSFKDSCLWNIPYVVIYFPANNPWPGESVQILADNFGGRLKIIPVDMSSQPRPQETKPVETTAPTHPETVPAIVVTLPPETEPAVTEAPTVPETTLSPTEPAETVIYTLPTMATQPAEEPEETGGISGGIIAVCLITGVLTFFLVGALIARSMRNKGGRYYN